MQKNNVKSFVCSFLFSILAVFAAQKMFLHSAEIEKEPKQTIKPQKISLFSESKAFVNNEDMLLKPTPKVDVSQIADLTAPKEEIKLAQAPVLQSSDEEKLPQKEKEPSVETDISFASEITLSAQERREIAENDKHLQSGVVYADISDTFEKPDNATTALTEEEIPLLENTTVLHNKINIISSSSNASKIAMVEPQTLINAIQEPDILQEEKNLAEADIKKSELGEMFEISNSSTNMDETAWDVATAATDNEKSGSAPTATFEEDSPWVMAKGNKYAKNQAAVEAFSQKDEKTNISPQEEQQDQTTVLKEEPVVEQTFIEPLLKEKSADKRLAYQMIQNILIPIPDDILNDGDLTPNLSDDSPNTNQSTKKKKAPKSDLNEDEKQSGLFRSISSWLGKNKDTDLKNSKDIKNKDSKKSTIDTVKGKINSALGSVEDYQKTGTNIMPAELRLSFQPNRAEISGQTLRWIYAFADNARDNDDVYIEVRIDGTSSYTLQQKRLNLLSSIFSSRGVDYRKINAIFTSREPNSFIIRNIRFNNKKGDADK